MVAFLRAGELIWMKFVGTGSSSVRHEDEHVIIFIAGNRTFVKS